MIFRPLPLKYPCDHYVRFFAELERLSVEEQIERMKVALRDDPGICQTKEYVRWGVKFAEVLR